MEGKSSGLVGFFLFFLRNNPKLETLSNDLVKLLSEENIPHCLLRKMQNR